MSAGGKISGAIAMGVVAVVAVVIVYSVTSGDKLSRFADGFMQGIGLKDGWYILGTDACAPISEGDKTIKTPEDVISKYGCSLYQDNEHFDSKTESSVTLDCHYSLGMDLVLIKGKKACNTELTNRNGADVYDPEDVLANNNNTTQAAQAQQADNINTQEPLILQDTGPVKDPYGWFVVTTEGQCLPLTAAGGKTPEEVKKRHSCQIISSQKILGAAEINYYMMECPTYGNDKSLLMIRGQYNCENRLIANSKSHNLTRTDWYVATPEGCKLLSAVVPGATSAQDYFNNYGCKVRTDEHLPNMYRAACSNTEGELLLVYEKKNCEGVLPHVKFKQ